MNCLRAIIGERVSEEIAKAAGRAALAGAALLAKNKLPNFETLVRRAIPAVAALGLKDANN